MKHLVQYQYPSGHFQFVLASQNLDTPLVLHGSYNHEVTNASLLTVTYYFLTRLDRWQKWCTSVGIWFPVITPARTPRPGLVAIYLWPWQKLELPATHAQGFNNRAMPMNSLVDAIFQLFHWFLYTLVKTTKYKTIRIALGICRPMPINNIRNSQSKQSTSFNRLFWVSCLENSQAHLLGITMKHINTSRLIQSPASGARSRVQIQIWWTNGLLETSEGLWIARD